MGIQNSNRFGVSFTGSGQIGSAPASGTSSVPKNTNTTEEKIKNAQGRIPSLISSDTTKRIVNATAQPKHETASKIKGAVKNFFMKFLSSKTNIAKANKSFESMSRHLDPKYVIANILKNHILTEKSPGNVMLYIHELVKKSHNSELQTECCKILEKIIKTTQNALVIEAAEALLTDVQNWKPDSSASPDVNPTNSNPPGAATFTPTNPQPTGAARTAPSAPNIDELLATATTATGSKKGETLRVLVHLLTPPPQPQTNYSEQAKEALKTLAKDPNQRGPIALTMQVVYNALSPAQNESREQLLNAFGEILSKYGYQAKLDPINGTDPFSYTQRT